VERNCLYGRPNAIFEGRNLPCSSVERMYQPLSEGRPSPSFIVEARKVEMVAPAQNFYWVGEKKNPFGFVKDTIARKSLDSPDIMNLSANFKTRAGCRAFASTSRPRRNPKSGARVSLQTSLKPFRN
jgi:hypothetical protein